MTTPATAPLTETKVRESLVDIVTKDLLGPAGGSIEEVDEDRVRDRYVVGQLAPRKQNVQPEDQDELAIAGAGTSEEGSAEPSAPAAPTIAPCSFGLTFSMELA